MFSCPPSLACSNLSTVVCKSILFLATHPIAPICQSHSYVLRDALRSQSSNSKQVNTIRKSRQQRNAKANSAICASPQRLQTFNIKVEVSMLCVQTLILPGKYQHVSHIGKHVSEHAHYNFSSTLLANDTDETCCKMFDNNSQTNSFHSRGTLGDLLDGIPTLS